jgi:hypothetical protein
MLYNPTGSVLVAVLRGAWADITGGNHAGAMQKIALISIAIQKQMKLFGETGMLQKKSEALSVKFYVGQSYADYAKQSKKIRDKGRRVSSVLHPYQGIDPIAVDMADSSYQHVFDCFVDKLKAHAKAQARAEAQAKEAGEVFKPTPCPCPWRGFTDENAKDSMVLSFYKLRAAIAFSNYIRDRKRKNAILAEYNAPVSMPPEQIAQAIKKDIKSKIKSILRKKDIKFINAWAANIYTRSNRAGGATKDITKPLNEIYGCDSIRTVYGKLKPFNIKMQQKLEAHECKQEYVQAALEIALNVIKKNDLLK